MHDQTNHLKFEGVQIETMAMSSICATEPRQVAEKDQQLACVYGAFRRARMADVFTTATSRLLNKQEGQNRDLSSYRSRHRCPDKRLRHIRLDHVMQYLIGDKLT